MGTFNIDREVSDLIPMPLPQEPEHILLLLFVRLEQSVVRESLAWPEPAFDEARFLNVSEQLYDLLPIVYRA